MRLSLLLACAFLASCATTRVHLFTEGMDTSELAQLQGTFHNAGYRTLLNTRPVPAEVTTPTAVYSPYHRDHRQMVLLTELLAELGYAVQLVPVSIGNNFFTGNNVGLYLKAGAQRERRDATSTGQPGSEAQLGGRDFSGRCPAVDAYLALHTDLTFILDLLAWDDGAAREVATQVAGTWVLMDSMLWLHSGSDSFAFRLEQFTDQLQIVGNPAAARARVTMQGIRLVNQGSSPAGCDFVHIVPMQL